MDTYEMMRIIKNMKVRGLLKPELKRRSREFRKEWALMNMKLEGSALSAEDIEQIRKGEPVLKGTLADHVLLTRLDDVLVLLDSLWAMDYDLTPAVLINIHNKVMGGDNGAYRKSTPTLYHLSHTPILPQDIGKKMIELFHRINKDSVPNPIERAVVYHNEIVKIYPFEEGTEITARAAMEYELFHSNLPMCSLTLSEQAYNTAIAEYIKRGAETAIGEDLLLAVKEQVDNMRI